jgi:hypothetical protein
MEVQLDPRRSPRRCARRPRPKALARLGNDGGNDRGLDPLIATSVEPNSLTITLDLWIASHAVKVGSLQRRTVSRAMCLSAPSQ